MIRIKELSLVLHLCILCQFGSGQGDFFKHERFLHPGLPGPWVKPTKGQVWPKPKLVRENGDNFMVLQMTEFEFKLDKFASKCDILQEAIVRYYKRTFPRTKVMKEFNEDHPWFEVVTSEPSFRGVLKSVEIVMNNPKGCEKYPHLDMDEHYQIKVDTPDEPQVARIIAFSVWGILRGLETFSQLVYSEETHGGIYQIRSLQLMDQPRFSWRGVMLDSSRHFLSKRVILENLDLMEINKMNVFHWHIVDDNSFPYESITFPNMSVKGAYRPYTHVYTQDDIKDIIEYARMRGIRVMSEFDTPGHTQSWELGHPGILAQCYQGSQPNGLYGPMDPTKASLYSFIKKFFKEVTTVFPDKFVHLGGDEVDVECWQSNPKIRKYVETKLKGDFRRLESQYIQKLLDIIDSYPGQNGYVVWQEVFDNHDRLKNDSIVEVWKGNTNEWSKSLSEITQAGLRALISAPWYLNYISYGSDWVNYYSVDPHNFVGSQEQKRLVLGGEACMWGEFVNSVNLIPRLWPRASAVAERLWSDMPQKSPDSLYEDITESLDISEAAKRLQEHECRMLTRGYPVEPINGPSFCDVTWK